MAEERLMTDAEIDAAFREAERFGRFQRAFDSVREIAQRYVRLKREVGAMEKQRADLSKSIDSLALAKKQAEEGHAADVRRLDLTLSQKTSQTQRAIADNIAEMDAATTQSQARRAELEKITADAEEASRKRIAELKQSVLDAEAKAALSMSDIDGAIAAKQADFDRVKANFDAFLAAHNLK